VPPAAASQVGSISLASLGEPGQTIPGSVTLNSPAEAGGVNVTLASSSAYVTVPASVNIPAGARSAAYSARIAAGAPTGEVIISGARSGTGNRVVTNILNISHTQVYSIDVFARQVMQSSGSYTVSPADHVVIGAANRARVVLERNAATDVTINLSSSDSSVTLPASVTVPAGQNLAIFSVTTSSGAGIGSATLSAVREGSGNIAKSKIVSLVPLVPTFISTPHLDWWPKSDNSSESAAPVTGEATVYINAQAPAEGVSLDIWLNRSDFRAGVSVPGSVLVPAGQTIATFAVTLGTQRPAQTSSLYHILAQRHGSTETASGYMPVAWH
jgi:hypothetical protein